MDENPEQLEERHSKDNPHKTKNLRKCSKCGKFEIVPAVGNDKCQFCGAKLLDSKYQMKPYLYKKQLEEELNGHKNILP